MDFGLIPIRLRTNLPRLSVHFRRLKTRRNDSQGIFLKNGPIPASFCLFLKISIIQIEKSIDGESNPWPQDGRRRRYHRAMAATPGNGFFPIVPGNGENPVHMKLLLFNCRGFV